MTEELLKIFDENRKTPLEDKLNRTIDSFEKMFDLFLEVTETIDNKLNSLQEQIDALEIRFNTSEQKLTKDQKTLIDVSPKPTPAIKKENLGNPRRALISELHDLFEKRNQNRNENE